MATANCAWDWYASRPSSKIPVLVSPKHNKSIPNNWHACVRNLHQGNHYLAWIIIRHATLPILSHQHSHHLLHQCRGRNSSFRFHKVGNRPFRSKNLRSILVDNCAMTLLSKTSASPATMPKSCMP